MQKGGEMLENAKKNIQINHIYKPRNPLKSVGFSVKAEGFEPSTACLEGRCSIQLSYASINYFKTACLEAGFQKISRGGRIRTCGLLLPKQAR